MNDNAQPTGLPSAAPAAEPVKALFGIDATTPEEVFEGWHEPDARWNGWAMPSFDRHQVDRLIAWVTRDPGDQTPTFTWDGDVLVEIEHQGDQPADDVITQIPPDEQGRYAIGAGSWTWTVIDLPDGWDLANWLDYEHDMTTAYVRASNLSNAHLTAQPNEREISPAHRFRTNNRVAETATALLRQLRPEDPSQTLDVDTVELAGLDATGRDGDPRFPYTWASLTPPERTTILDLVAAIAFNDEFTP